jgi:cyclic pyranopterin phosphate synthase
MEFDIRQLGYEEAIRLAIGLKPECGTKNEKGAFYNIGG